MNFIKDYLNEYIRLNETHWLMSSIEFLLVSLFAFIIYIVIKKYVIGRVKVIISKTKWNFGNFLIKNSFFAKILVLIPLGIMINYTEGLSNELVSSIADVLVSSMIIVVSVGTIYSFLDASVELAATKRLNKLPLKPISQLLKIAITLMSVILLYSNAIGESMTNIFAGLGAMSAILMLVFKDSIQSFVSALQITLYKTIDVGDWLEVSSLGVDGDVIEINLNNITVQNWDKSVATIPTHSLMNNVYKNYNPMFNIGRRIKRSINLDTSTFKILDKNDIEELKNVRIINDYLKEKELEFGDFFSVDNFDSVNKKNLTNVGTFRKYINYYLNNRSDILKTQTLLVRQLDDIGNGLPIELYCFTSDTSWNGNESIKSDIFDHLYVVAKIFGLKTFQSPTGNDFKKL